jgi:hypothetical protein
MSSIFEEINNLEDKDWDYYNRTSEFPNKKIDNWNVKQNHKVFIDNFLKLSEKMDINISFENVLDDFERDIHTNSVFFLGCLFYKKLDFKNKTSFIRDGRDEFHFIWFITSLIHDFGYKIENNKEKYKEITKDIDNFKKYFSINNDLLKQPTNGYSNNMQELIKDISPYYSDRYNGKRSDGSLTEGKIDHGIASGLILYNSLVKNRKEMKERYGENDTKHNLYWGNGLDKVYEISAYSIAVHNIRRRKDNALIFSIEEDAFLFLFWLTDTIEPTKCFDCCNPQYVLENIIIEFHDNKKGFTVRNREDSKLDFTKYKKDIENLERFLDIKVNTKETNEIVLSW